MRASARWHTRGKPVVYLAESPAGALLEVLVHLNGHSEKLPRTYTLLRINMPDEIEIEDLPVPSDWKSSLSATQALGDAWLKGNRTALARVPSAVVAHTANLLLNPAHPAATGIRIVEVTEEALDPRLIYGANQSL